MKFTAILLAVVLCAASLFSPLALAEGQDEAVRVPVVFSTDKGASMYNLVDGSNYSYAYFTDQRSFVVTADKEFAYLYIRWHGEVQPWECTAAGQTLQCGEYGYLHELVELPEPVRQAEIHVSGDAEFGITDVLAYSAGTLPEEVQRWEPPCEKADLLLFPTHSDDELVFFGGIIPYYAGELGLNVQVCYLTDHYIGMTFSHRCHELLDSQWKCGNVHYPVVNPIRDENFANAEKAAAIHESFTAFQVEQIRRFQPSVIVGQDVKGEYGHLYHVFNVECLMQAVELAADPDAYPELTEKYGTWDTPKTYLHLYGDPNEWTTLDYETPLYRFGGKTGYQIATEAFALCVSQKSEGSFTIYRKGHPFDSHVFGLFRSTVGPDEGKNDLLEHLSSYDW